MSDWLQRYRDDCHVHRCGMVYDAPLGEQIYIADLHLRYRDDHFVLPVITPYAIQDNGPGYTMRTPIIRTGAGFRILKDDLPDPNNLPAWEVLITTAFPIEIIEDWLDGAMKSPEFRVIEVQIYDPNIWLVDYSRKVTRYALVDDVGVWINGHPFGLLRNMIACDRSTNDCRDLLRETPEEAWKDQTQWYHMERDEMSGNYKKIIDA